MKKTGDDRPFEIRTRQLQNRYYKQYYGRKSVVRDAILNFFLDLSSYPRLVMEVFLRKDLGQRYFNLASAWTVAIILLITPYLLEVGRSDFNVLDTLGDNILWYAFVVAYLVFAHRRWWEIRLGPSVFDFAKFTLSSGRINRKFFEVRPFGSKPTPRLVEIFYEPLVFFLPGVLLMLAGQLLGILFVFCAIVYSLSYAGAYSKGDNFIMDIIDQKIMNEDMQEDFSSDNDYGRRGTKWYMQKPNGEDKRREFTEYFTDLEEVGDVL